jgi:hypothetical protein
MGFMINEIYKIVTEKTGFKGRMRLAVRTGISRTKAAQMEDTPEMITKFKSAANEIVGGDIDPLLNRR